MSAKHPTTGERCVIACRTSDDRQSSIPDQDRWGRRLAESKSWPVVAVIKDEGWSGDDQSRPGLAELYEVFRANHAAGCPIRVLLVWHTNRLSRDDVIAVFAILHQLRLFGLRWVVTSQRTIDLLDRTDRTMYALQQDHENNPFLGNNAEATLRGMADAARAGFWIGWTPLGYQLVKTPGEHGAGKRRRSGRLVIDPETGRIVLELFERYAAGESTTDLARWLTALVKPHRAPAWTPQSVREVLQNELYTGIRRFGDRPQGKHVRLSATGPVPIDDDQGEAELDAALVMTVDELRIVPPELFTRVQARLASGRRRGHHKGHDPLPLSGLGKCGCCGGPLYAAWGWNQGTAKTRGPRQRRKVRQLMCGKRRRYGPAVCPDGSTAFDHDHVLARIFELLADTLLKDGTAERLTRLAELRAGEAEQRRQATRNACQHRLAQLDTMLGRSQRRLLAVADDLLENAEAELRRVKAERAAAQKELDELDKQKTQTAALDPARFRAFWERCRDATALFEAGRQQGAYPPSLGLLLAELVVGFTVHFERDAQGRSTPAHVDVELPRWLTLLASQGTPAC
jgi:site-specific DNA recombinase